MANLISVPIMVMLIMIQTSVIARLPLLNGTADLILLVLVAWSLQERVKNAWIWAVCGGLLVCLVSATPFYAPVIGYLLVTGLGSILSKRIWQAPILAMFVLTYLGTFLYQGILYIALLVNGVNLDWRQSMNQVALPSVLLNLALVLPVYSIITDLAHWVFPVKADI